MIGEVSWEHLKFKKEDEHGPLNSSMGVSKGSRGAHIFSHPRNISNKKEDCAFSQSFQLAPSLHPLAIANTGELSIDLMQKTKTEREKRKV
jgi:hypothetical protein